MAAAYQLSSRLIWLEGVQKILDDLAKDPTNLAEMQRAAGLINPRVYHSADSNKSEIVVVFDTEDTKKAKEFAASGDLKEAMTKAGVLDTPTIYFLESID